MFVNEIKFFNIGYNNNDKSIAPIGINNKEWVKCLWYSIKSKVSSSDLIKISRSGIAPPMAPQNADILSEFFFEKDDAKLAPNKPCDTGSIYLSF